VPLVAPLRYCKSSNLGHLSKAGAGRRFEQLSYKFDD
jgi:hypothetical protein